MLSKVSRDNGTYLVLQISPTRDGSDQNQCAAGQYTGKPTAHTCFLHPPEWGLSTNLTENSISTLVVARKHCIHLVAASQS
jgi:hypothetical protein